MQSAKLPIVQAFNGLNNVSDPTNLGLDWLVQADNIDITDHAKLSRRVGYSRTLAATEISGAYATIDAARLYFVDSGVLKALTAAGPVTLRSGLNSALMHWAEINGQVFYTNGVDNGIVLPDNTALSWGWASPPAPALSAGTGTLPAGLYRVAVTSTLADGRMTGAGEVSEIVLAANQSLQITGMASDANVFIAPANSTVFQLAGKGPMTWNGKADNLGKDLVTFGLGSLPAACTVIEAWRGRVYAAQYIAAEDFTALWCSQALAFHLFDLAKDLKAIPGRILMLAGLPGALIIGTERAIHVWDGQRLEQVANYGVIPGWHADQDEKRNRTLFWSARGLCEAMPFKNLTEEQISVAPGLVAGGSIVSIDGQSRYIVTLKQGGDAYNAFN